MPILDSTTFASALKTLYPTWALQNAVFRNNPFLALVSKETDFGGDFKKIPLQIGAPQNTSADFSVAANSGSSLLTTSTLRAWLLTRARKYALIEISNETMLASQGKENAFIEAVKLETDGGLRSISNQLGLDIFGDGSGVVGRLSATSGVTTSITLANPTQATTLEIGALLRFSALGTGASMKTGTLQITSINRSTGVIGLSASGATLTPVLAVNDYVYISGNQAACVAGLSGWLPSTAPSGGDSWFSVDRSVDSRLYGNYLDQSSAPIEEGLLQIDQVIYNSGGAATHIILNPVDYTNLAKSLGSRVVYEALSIGDVGFQTYKIQGMSGPLTVLADRSCPLSNGFVLQMDTWKMNSLGQMVEIYNGDGLSMLRSTTSDSVRAQIAFYGNLSCSMPAWNGRVLLAS